MERIQDRIEIFDFGEGFIQMLSGNILYKEYYAKIYKLHARQYFYSCILSSRDFISKIFCLASSVLLKPSQVQLSPQVQFMHLHFGFEHFAIKTSFLNILVWHIYIQNIPYGGILVKMFCVKIFVWIFLL